LENSVVREPNLLEKWGAKRKVKAEVKAKRRYSPWL